jgi:hypothetical protein
MKIPQSVRELLPKAPLAHLTIAKACRKKSGRAGSASIVLRLGLPKPRPPRHWSSGWRRKPGLTPLALSRV